MSNAIGSFKGPFWKAAGLLLVLYNLGIDVNSVKHEDVREFAKRFE